MSGTDGTGTYTAPDVPSAVRLKLNVKTGPSRDNGPTANKNVIAPTLAEMVQVPGTSLRHQQGLAGVGFKGMSHIRGNVSYGNIEFSEGVTTGTGTGYWSSLNNRQHPQGQWLSVGNCNSTDGCEIIGTDTVDTGDGNPPFSVGDFAWGIPWQYRVNGGTTRSFLTANHHQTISATGKTAIAKAGAGPFAKKPSDPTSTY